MNVIKKEKKQMKKYECPYCHQKTFTLWQKFIAGGMTSKGIKCPVCQKHCVHGLKSTIFSSIVMGIAFIYTIIVLVTNYGSNYSALICIIAAFLISKCFNAFVCDLDKNNRNDV